MDKIRLERIENDHKISEDPDFEFLYVLQKALLLSLLESGTLTQEKYHYAEEALRRQMHKKSGEK